MDLHECYTLLELNPGASLPEIRVAYRKLAKQWHPDRFVQDPEQLQQATSQFQRINEAYETLRLGEEGASHRQQRDRTGGVQSTSTDPEFYYQAAQGAANADAPQEAIEHLNQAIRLKPDYLRAYQYRAFLHDQLGHQHQAEADFIKVAQLKLEATTSEQTVEPPSPPPQSSPAPSSRSQDSATSSTEWQCLDIVTGLEGYARSLAIHPSQPWVATTDGTQRIHIWHLHERRWIQHLSGHLADITQVAWHPKGNCLASASVDRSIRLWNQSQNQPLAILKGHSDRVLSLAWNQDGNILISGSADRTVKLWNCQTQTVIKILTGYGADVTALAAHSQYALFASGGLEPSIRLRHGKTGKLSRSFQGNGGTLSLAFHPHQHLLASGGYDATVYLWDLSDRADPQRFEGHEDRISALTFSPDGRVLATGSWDATIRIWDVQTGQAIATLTDHDDVVSALSFTPQGEQLISCSWDGTLRLWQVPTM